MNPADAPSRDEPMFTVSWRRRLVACCQEVEHFLSGAATRYHMEALVHAQPSSLERPLRHEEPDDAECLRERDEAVLLILAEGLDFSAQWSDS